MPLHSLKSALIQIFNGRLSPPIQFVLEFFAIMILVSLVNVYFAIPTLIMATILVALRHVYVSTSRNIKRVESISKSPIFAHTNATLQGLSTIRALKAERAVIENFNFYVDHNTSVRRICHFAN
jgi:ATP-binding cassette subfamily C (CFTR/MRP) protein 4